MKKNQTTEDWSASAQVDWVKGRWNEREEERGRDDWGGMLNARFVLSVHNSNLTLKPGFLTLTIQYRVLRTEV